MTALNQPPPQERCVKVQFRKIQKLLIRITKYDAYKSDKKNSYKIFFDDDACTKRMS